MRIIKVLCERLLCPTNLLQKDTELESADREEKSLLPVIWAFEEGNMDRFTTYTGAQ